MRRKDQRRERRQMRRQQQAAFMEWAQLDGRDERSLRQWMRPRGWINRRWPRNLVSSMAEWRGVRRGQ